MFKQLFKITFIASLLLIILLTAGLPATTVLAAEPPDKRDTTQEPDPAYLTAIQNTTAMVTDAQAQSLAAQYGLNIVNVTCRGRAEYLRCDHPGPTARPGQRRLQPNPDAGHPLSQL